jgi:hypothetical protein
LRKIRTNHSANFGPSHDHPPLHLRPHSSISSCTSTCFAEEPNTECSICRQLARYVPHLFSS